MSPPSPEDSFARFRDGGDPQALAEVFDQTANQLLGVALHLTRSADAAEDLLQETFLAAIEHRASFHSKSCSVFAWLLGILHNRAKRRWRERRRERDKTTDVADRRKLVDESEDGRNPLMSAAGEECSAVVTDRIAALPEQYRLVLRLHLLHDMTAAHIALVLDRPPGTVRTQIVRGLEMLRRDLPQGLALGGVAVSLPASGLTVVRESVVRAAAALNTSTPVGVGVLGVTLGAFLMKKSVAVAGVLFLLMFAGLGSVWFESSDGSGDPPFFEPSVVAEGESALAEGAATSPPGVVRKPDSAEQRVDTDASFGSRAVVVGRCVDGRGSPLAGVRVQLSARLTLEAMRRRHRSGESSSWPVPDPVLTGAEGRFAVALAPPGEDRVLAIRLTRQDRLSLTDRNLKRVQPEEHLVLGDIEMLRGCRVRGVIRDTTGASRGGIRLSLQKSRIDRSSLHGIRPTMNVESTASEDGSFEFADRVPPGAWEVSIANQLVANPRTIVVDLTQVDRFLSVTLKAESEIPRIEGIVVDANGTPVKGAVFRARGGDIARAKTGVDGRFVVRLLGGDRSTVILSARRRGFEEATMAAPIDWGTRDVRLVMPRARGVEIRVTDGRGEPLEDYSVIALEVRKGGSYSSDRQPRIRGHHAAGVAVLQLPRGSYALLIEPANEGWAHSGFHHLTVVEQGAKLDVVLQRNVPRTIRVVTKRGRPVVGTRIELIEPVASADSRPVSFRTWLWRLNDPIRKSSTSRDMALFRAVGKTDAAGELEFEAPPGSGYVLRVHGPGHQPFLRSRVEFTAGMKPLVLRVDGGGEVFGRVRPSKLVEQIHAGLAGKVAQPDTDRGRGGVGFRVFGRTATGATITLPPKYKDRFPILPNGSFKIPGLPAGTWKLLLHLWPNETEVVSEISDLRSGESRELDLDLHRLVFAEVRGRVTFNGEPIPGSTLTFSVIRDEYSRWRNLTIGAGGLYRASLVPDDYQPILQYKVSDGYAAQLPAERAFVFEPGQRLERDIEFLGGWLEITVVGEGDKPRPGVRLHVVHQASERTADPPATDRTGRTKTLTSPGEVHLYAWKKTAGNEAGRAKRLKIKVGECLVKAGKTTEVRLQVPDSKGR